MLPLIISILTLLLLFIFVIYLGLASVGHKFFIHKIYVSNLLKLFEYGHARGVEHLNYKRVQLRRRRKHQEQQLKQQQQSKSMENTDDNNGNNDNNNDNRKLLKRKASNESNNSSIHSSSSSSFALDSDYNSDSAFDSSDDHYDYLGNNRNNHSNTNNGTTNEVPESFRQNCSMTLRLSKSLNKNRIKLSTIMDFTTLGIEAIIDDNVTKRFAAEELRTWNLLTRTDKFHFHYSMRLTLIWLCGTLFRYTLLFPMRFCIFIISIGWLSLVCTFLGLLSRSKFRKTIQFYLLIHASRLLSRSFGSIINYHDVENRAQPGSICVANHTSPIDVIILHCDNCYSLIGQSHSGILGQLQRTISRATDHIWFDRFQIADRQAVSKRLREHTQMKKMPILIFPEGTCINNSAVMMFKKGSFEIDAPIYPVAIKYDARFGDPFWNSSKYGYLRYWMMMMTSWAIVCDVWYLPPMTRQPNESAIEFANRVKSKIASKGGLVDLDWDGQLKRQPLKPELLKQQQTKFSQTLLSSSANDEDDDGDNDDNINNNNNLNHNGHNNHNHPSDKYIETHDGNNNQQNYALSQQLDQHLSKESSLINNDDYDGPLKMKQL